MIQIRNLSKIYNTDSGQFKALENINLTIEDGDIFGIIGMSGAGKSTLLRCLNLLEHPTSGEIIIDGEEITKFTGAQLLELRRHMGMVFQKFNLLTQRPESRERKARSRAPGARRPVVKGRQLSVAAFRRPAAACFNSESACQQSKDHTL